MCGSRPAGRLAKAGVQLVSITQDVGTDASGEFIRKTLSVFDEHRTFQGRAMAIDAASARLICAIARAVSEAEAQP